MLKPCGRVRGLGWRGGVEELTYCWRGDVDPKWREQWGFPSGTSNLIVPCHLLLFSLRNRLSTSPQGHANTSPPPHLHIIGLFRIIATTYCPVWGQKWPQCTQGGVCRDLWYRREQIKTALQKKLSFSICRFVLFFFATRGVRSSPQTPKHYQRPTFEFSTPRSSDACPGWSKRSLLKETTQ